ncbi:MAG: alkaline phosphatase family protein [Candidatus Krumholzibacteriota bacterium]|nr:alkaline phosphatase family protein [Candidatus Krumholzibacteriota bacterium]
MQRLVVIGIDGMDWLVTKPLLSRMPSLQKIAGSGFAGEMPAIFPPDSIPSWISIFTGMDPSGHGILETIDYFKKDAREFTVDTGAFRGKTFWDKTSALGKKVIVVNPLMAYPPWKVNGVMASGPVFISGDASAYPPEVEDSIELPPLGGIVDFPEKSELKDFYEKTKEETWAITDFTARLMESREWDLTFVTLLTMDRICHFFWRYYDREDPTHPGENSLSGIIPDFHVFIDKCIGRLVEASDENTSFLIISDHGHAMRPPLLFNLNQLLMDHGLLESRIKGPKLFSPRYHLERTKNIILETLHRLDMEDLSYRLAHIFPWTRKLKKKDFMTSSQNNVATASGFGGTNPFGGIEISRERCLEESLDYEETREKVIRIILDLRDRNGNPYFLWAKRREEMFSGPFTDKFPDILYEMKPEYGTNWSVHLPLVTLNPRHRKISGGHRKNSVLIFGPANGWKIIENNIRSVNIAPSVLSFFSGVSDQEPRLRERSFLGRIEKDPDASADGD